MNMFMCARQQGILMVSLRLELQLYTHPYLRVKDQKFDVIFQLIELKEFYPCRPQLNKILLFSLTNTFIFDYPQDIYKMKKM